MRVLFLDVDGVLNRTGYKPAESRGLVSWIEPELAARLARTVPQYADQPFHRVLVFRILHITGWAASKDA